MKFDFFISIDSSPWISSAFVLICNGEALTVFVLVCFFKDILVTNFHPHTYGQLIFDKGSENILWRKDSLFSQWCLESWISSVQFSSVAQSCPTLCDPMNCSTPGLPVHHKLPEFTQTHVHRVGDAIQPSHPLSSPSPPAPYPSQHHGLFFAWINSSHEVAKVLEFQLQHQTFQ